MFLNVVHCKSRKDELATWEHFSQRFRWQTLNRYCYDIIEFYANVWIHVDFDHKENVFRPSKRIKEIKM